MIVLVVNASASGGKGGRRWPAVEAELRARGLVFETIATTSEEDASRRIDEAMAAGRRTIVACGGDGTVNAALNHLMDPETDRARPGVLLGAIGLGSSNDFHKPFRPERTVAGVPARIAVERASAIDLGKAVIETPAGIRRTRYFCLNASLGLVAEGNAYFNHPDPLLARLKRCNVEVAILYTALVNLFLFRPVRVRVTLDRGESFAELVSTLGVLKKVHFAGGMRYDTSVVDDDGFFDVTVWGRMGRWNLVRTLMSLYKGRFLGLPYCRAYRARTVEVVLDRASHLETDGEVTPIVRAILTVVPRALRVCG